MKLVLALLGLVPQNSVILLLCGQRGGIWEHRLQSHCVKRFVILNQSNLGRQRFTFLSSRVVTPGGLIKLQYVLGHATKEVQYVVGDDIHLTL